MVKKLDVYLKNMLVGNLIQGDDGQVVFDYVESWLNNPPAVRFERYTTEKE